MGRLLMAQQQSARTAASIDRSEAWVRLTILPPGHAYVPDGHVKNLQRQCEENFV
ncbi:hypothetical protein KIN20_014092 [Parelaphostrongylus tenuis]|uniref:Uncharacterized protein n=1 Tax=Parelaphostrongylus tenuis TaxID=148309 RepID=A0AAD5MYI0_PARTN|nr:hypothetical protein KIN20_014092 [Parelaphostrongylus tenuis]